MNTAIDTIIKEWVKASGHKNLIAAVDQLFETGHTNIGSQGILGHTPIRLQFENSATGEWVFINCKNTNKQNAGFIQFGVDGTQLSLEKHLGS